MRCLWILMLFLTGEGLLGGQEPMISSSTPVNTATLHHWIQTGSPRLIAWAATFARDTHNTSVLAELPFQVEQLSFQPGLGEGDWRASHKAAVNAILDAIIQENVHVPTSTIQRVADGYPAQSAVLVSRLTLPESRQILNDWTYGVTGAPGERLLARVASMMLAKDPDPTFVARTTATAELDIKIDIRVKNKMDFSGLGGACGDSIGHEPASGWPEVYTYSLSENEYSADVRPVVELDGDSINYTRRLEHQGWGSCNGVEWLDSSTRHRLIAHWLGVEDSQMAWQPVEGFVILWVSKRAYEYRLGSIIEGEREKLRETIQTLIRRGYLFSRDAEMVSPRLVLSVNCEIKPCPLR